MRFVSRIILSAACFLLMSASFTAVNGQKAKRGKTAALPIAVRIEREADFWDKEQPANVKVTLTNKSSRVVALPSLASFHLQAQLPPETSENRREYERFWGPIDWHINYDNPNPKNLVHYNPSCVESHFYTKMVEKKDPQTGRVISQSYLDELPPTHLNPKQKLDFKFDLAKICWQRGISSNWPNQNLFATAPGGNYVLYFSLTDNDSIISNKIAVAIK